MRRELHLKLGNGRESSKLEGVNIKETILLLGDRRDANTWSRRAIRVMRQLQPWIVEPKIRMPGRGLRIISLRTLFEHWRSLPEWWVRRRSPLLNFTVTARDETAADLLAAGTENISLAEWFHFLGRLSISLWSLQKAYFFFVL